MNDAKLITALPTPAQMRNYFAAERAAWQARRLRESSRALITGNIAFVACLIGTTLVLTHSDWFQAAGPFVLCGILLAYVVCLIMSLRWMKRQRSRSSVMVLDQREVEAERALAHPFRVAVVVSAMFLFQLLALVLGGVALRHMSSEAIYAAIAVGPALATGFFVYRFVVYRFWEDLLFAAAVVMAHTPFFVQAWDLTPLSLVALALVIVGTISLHLRWVHGTQAFPAEERDECVEEVRP